jgi:hypothetical protein
MVNPATRQYPFGSNLVLTERISDATLRAYCVGFDQSKFRLGPLVDLLVKVIPEFALGYYHGTSVPMTEIVPIARKAARRVYLTDNYKSRGEFGELILHLLLRDHFGSVPLISKINFKDTPNETVHGFDGVHVVVENGEKQLWLGESKIYGSGSEGVRALAKDLELHLSADYLRQEFELVAPKLPVDAPDIEYWRRLMHEHTRLDEILDKVCIPAVCTYTSPIYGNHTACTDRYLEEFVKECRSLQRIFEDRPIATDVDILLLLLPVESKDELVTELDKRLKHMQSI